MNKDEIIKLEKSGWVIDKSTEYDISCDILLRVKLTSPRGGQVRLSHGSSYSDHMSHDRLLFDADTFQIFENERENYINKLYDSEKVKEIFLKEKRKSVKFLTF